MFDAETVTFLESGCSLIVGLVGPSGEPVAGRGWGLTVLDASSGRLRLLVDADDDVATGLLVDRGRIAVTATSVRTMRSMQMKGRLVTVAAATDDDLARAATYRDAFFGDIVETEGTPRKLIERITPAAFAVSMIDVDEVFDQTPGPRAGTSMETTA